MFPYEKFHIGWLPKSQKILFLLAAKKIRIFKFDFGRDVDWGFHKKMRPFCDFADFYKNLRGDQKKCVVTKQDLEKNINHDTLCPLLL